MKQASKESLIYLLYLALYADGVLSETEDDSFTEAIESLGWEGSAALQDFSMEAFGIVRDLLNHPENAEAFVFQHAKIIQDHDDTIAAFTLISRVLRSDELEVHEKSLLKKLERHWFPN